MAEISKINSSSGLKLIGGLCNDDGMYPNGFMTGYTTLPSWSTTSWTTSSGHDLNLSKYLPADGCTYEVQVYGILTSSATAHRILGVYLTTDIDDFVMQTTLIRTVTRTAATIKSSGIANVFVGASRIVRVKSFSGTSSTGELEVYVRWVKRLAKDPTSNKLTHITAKGTTYDLGGAQFPSVVTSSNALSVWQGAISGGGSTGPNQVDLSTYLTDTDADYEVGLQIYGNTLQNSSGKEIQISCTSYDGTSFITSPICVVPRTTANWIEGNQFTTKVKGSNPKVILQNLSSNGTSTIYLKLCWRRKGAGYFQYLNPGAYVRTIELPDGTKANFSPIEAGACDGPFVQSEYNIMNMFANMTSSSTPKTLDLSNYLPTNNEWYFIYTTSTFATNTNASATSLHATLEVLDGSSNIISSNFLGAVTTNSSSNYGLVGHSTVILAKQFSGKLHLRSRCEQGGIATTSAVSSQECKLLGYRKLGSVSR